MTAGRVAQEYNIRKSGKGAFREDRHHATAVETDSHLIRCIVYTDLNMVRAGVVSHPSEWEFCGYNEIRNPKKRKGIIDFKMLMYLLDIENRDLLKEAHHEWVDNALSAKSCDRESQWTQSIAVGSKNFIEKIKTELGPCAKGRTVIGSNDDMFQLREKQSAYAHAYETVDNTFTWEQ
ncbi:MAG: hypothetical protein GY749_35755 [Desulfobacteraceae bacterium]|nr:hypothetical protein [Desulfobacteraceae bacterium]